MLCVVVGRCAAVFGSDVACFHPLTAFQPDGGGPLRFIPTQDVRYQFDYPGRELKIPCGRCIGCKLKRARAWAIRCVHEASCYDVNSFVTLTYADKFLRPSLNHSDFQHFMYRVRKRFGPTRFFMCGEYGDLNLRPHFHCLLFGRTFTDGVPCGKLIFSSAVLSKLWPYGFSSFGSVTPQSAAYVARYTVKKVNGPLAEVRYTRVDKSTGEIFAVRPEYGRMSLKPGIGYPWFAKFWREVYIARDGVVQAGGRVVPAPRYYDQCLERLDCDLKYEKDFYRYVASSRFQDDCTPERLRVREIVSEARESLRRSTL